MLLICCPRGELKSVPLQGVNDYLNYGIAHLVAHNSNYHLAFTRDCLTVLLILDTALPDPFSIFPRGVWERD